MQWNSSAFRKLFRETKQLLRDAKSYNCLQIQQSIAFPLFFIPKDGCFQ